MKVKVGDLYYGDSNDTNEIHREVIDSWRHGYVEKLIFPVKDTHVALERMVQVYDDEVFSKIDDMSRDEYVELPEVELREVTIKKWVEV